MAGHGIGMVEALLGLDGFRVLEVSEGDGELIVRIETTVDVEACVGCGRRAESQDRVDRAFRDLWCFGRPVRRVGDPFDEVLGAWLAKESVRDIYLTDQPDDAAVLIDKAIAGCLDDDVDEIRALGRTLRRWRSEILAHHITGASNGPTEGLNLLVKKVKRCGHGFKRFEHYRLRVLLQCGGITWNTPSPPTLRPRTPHPNA